MKFALPARWPQPAPDSLVAQDLRLGRSAWTHHIHLVWSIWVFITRRSPARLRLHLALAAADPAVVPLSCCCSTSA